MFIHFHDHLQNYYILQTSDYKQTKYITKLVKK